MPSVLDTFAADLKAERQRLNLTQAQTADLLEVKKTTVEKWEYGTNIPLAVTAEGVLARLRKAKPSA